MKKITIPPNEFSFSYSRSSGPGGQNVNKVNTKVTLHWNALTTVALPPAIHQRFLKKYHTRLNSEGILTIISQQHRSQGLNMADAVAKLEAMIEAVIVPPKVRKVTKPTRTATLKRLNVKKLHGEKKKNRQEKY